MRTVIPGPLAYAPHAHVAYGRAQRGGSSTITPVNRFGWMLLGAAGLAYWQSTDAQRSRDDRSDAKFNAIAASVTGLVAILIS